MGAFKEKIADRTHQGGAKIKTKQGGDSGQTARELKKERRVNLGVPEEMIGGKRGRKKFGFIQKKEGWNRA